jgi:8-oxo-dGTP diphosphatase
MQIYLIRHAHAGQRRSDRRDIYRPLSVDGSRRAEELVELFAGVAVDRLVSSPAVRCVQTLEPLGRARALPVTEHQSLWEGSTTWDALAGLATLEGEEIVACSHGDIIPAVIDELGSQGVPVSGRGCELGSIWVLHRDREGAVWTRARYFSPKVTALR